MKNSAPIANNYQFRNRCSYGIRIKMCRTRAQLLSYRAKLDSAIIKKKKLAYIYSAYFYL